MQYILSRWPSLAASIAVLLLGMVGRVHAQEVVDRSSPFGTDLLGEASVSYDSNTGTLMVLTDPVTNSKIQEIIELLDKPVPQVNVQVTFLELTHSDNVDLGAEFFYQSALETDIVGNITRDISATTNLGIPTAGEGAYYSYIDTDFEATLRALSNVGKLDVLSQPAILVRNNETGSVSIGQEVPFVRNSQITNEGNTINTVEYEDVGILLEVTPYINAGGLVELTLSTEISTITGENISITEGVVSPVFATRSAQTSAVASSGQTIVIGGLIETNQTKTTTGVPILSKIPIIGFLFKNFGTRKVKTELLIFLTPYVLQEEDELTTFARSEVNRAERLRDAFERLGLSRSLEELPAKIDRDPSIVSRPPENKRFVINAPAAPVAALPERHSQVRRRSGSSNSPVARNTARSKVPGTFNGGVLYNAPGVSR